MEAAGKSEKSHPVRGGTLDVFVMFYLLGISIHPPRAGWDAQNVSQRFPVIAISIHPARAGWDIEVRNDSIAI